MDRKEVQVTLRSMSDFVEMVARNQQSLIQLFRVLEKEGGVQVEHLALLRDLLREDLGAIGSYLIGGVSAQLFSMQDEIKSLSKNNHNGRQTVLRVDLTKCLECSPQTVKRMIERGELPEPQFKPGTKRKAFFYVDELSLDVALKLKRVKRH